MNMIYLIINAAALAAIFLACLNGLDYEADGYGRAASLTSPDHMVYRLQEVTSIGRGGLIELNCSTSIIELQERGFVLSGGEADVVRRGEVIPSPVVLQEDDTVRVGAGRFLFRFNYI
jgi:hypothetical protein